MIFGKRQSPQQELKVSPQRRVYLLILLKKKHLKRGYALLNQKKSEWSWYTFWVFFYYMCRQLLKALLAISSYQQNHQTSMFFAVSLSFTFLLTHDKWKKSEKGASRPCLQSCSWTINKVVCFVLHWGKWDLWGDICLLTETFSCCLQISSWETLCHTGDLYYV